MKMTKKKVFVVAIAICLIAVISMGTLAWFSDSDEVTNKFMVATSSENPDDVFSVDVWEYENDNDPESDADGDGDNDITHEGNTYEDILPGGRYHKEPYIENTGAYDQYIRVTLTINNLDKTLAGALNGYKLTDIIEGFDANAWTIDGNGYGTYDETAKTYTMVLYLNYKLAPGEKACLFNTVVIPSVLTQEHIATLGGGFDMNIVADAVQTENVGDTAQEAFATVEADQEI